MIYMRIIKTEEMLRQLVRKMAPPLGMYIRTLYVRIIVFYKEINIDF
jgi:hypothetical protein